MATIDIDDVSKIIREVADEIIMPRWRNLAAHEISRKAGAGSLVTIADHEAEAALERRLGALLPGAHVIGEEAVAADPKVLELLRKPEPIWVVDPIDGTRKFTEGRTDFDVIVALIVGGRTVAGWILAPAEDSLIRGEAGAGVWRTLGQTSARLDGVDRNRRLCELTGIVSQGGFKSRGYSDPGEVEGRFRGYVRHMCAGHNYTRLLTGDCDFLINFSTLPWDHVAGLMLTGEAGFHHARLDAAPFDPLDPSGGLLVAPSTASWTDIRATLIRRP